MDKTIILLKKTRVRLQSQSKYLADFDIPKLRRFRIELLTLVREIQALISASKNSISQDDVSFLKDFLLELDNLEIEVSSEIFAREQERALYTLWESELIPEPLTAQNPIPKFPALAKFQVPNLFDLMDDSWLPKPRPNSVEPLRWGVAS